MVKRRGPASALSEAQWQQVLARRAAGESVRSLSEAFGVKKGVIYKRTIPAGLNAPPPSFSGRRFAARPVVFPEAQVRQWMAAIERKLGRYRNHPEFEEMLGDAYLAMAIAMREVTPDRVKRAPAFILTAGRHGALQYLMSPRCRYRRFNREGQELPLVENLEALLEEQTADRRAAFSLRTPDFVPPLLQRLWLLSVWKQAARGMTDLEREVVGRLFFEEEAADEIAGDYGLSKGQVYRIRTAALTHFRQVIAVTQAQNE